MVQDSYNILNDILVDLRCELSDLDAQIYQNSLYIREAEEQLKSLGKEEDDDFKFFSPRNTNGQLKERIEGIVSSKAGYEEKSSELNKKREILEKKIIKVEEVIKQENENFTILTAQEKDRQRIARDLHDTALQNVAHLIHKIELCEIYIEKDPQRAKQELSSVNAGLREIVGEIRDTVFDLRPMTFDDLGLKAAFERLLEKINQDNKFEIQFHIDDVSCENEMTLLYLYRIVQEGLSNIIKHAGARRINFNCRILNSVCYVDLDDDGQGFDADESKGDKHFGLSLMRERVEQLNGKINIFSVRGEGTKIHVEIPV